MKQKILLSFVLGAFASAAQAQNPTAFAITGVEKGHHGWTEVRLIDMTTGEAVKNVYQRNLELEVLNARTGKAVAKRTELQAKQSMARTAETRVIREVREGRDAGERTAYKVDGNTIYVYGKQIKDVKDLNGVKEITTQDGRTIQIIRSTGAGAVPSDHPFSTNSAACAYDKKHGRIYYTPMGINELRYIDLKSKTPRIYFFENEAFGALSSSMDVPNQITRMVIGADGNGYALSNNAKNFIKFTTDRKAKITNLGALTDDPANGSNSVHSSKGYGGDMIADAFGDFFLITANRAVFKIDGETLVASYKGTIQGLPRGYTTNGAAVEKNGGSTVLVSSSNTTLGYYRFDLNTLQAEPLPNNGSVYNASDLANENLAFSKKNKEEEKLEIVKPETPLVEARQGVRPQDAAAGRSISVFPNPVTNGFVRLSFANQPEGKYVVQFMDIAGKLISSHNVAITNKMQVEEFTIPELSAKGNYLVRVLDASRNVSMTEKLVVQ